MCGIAGILNAPKASSLPQIAVAMGDSIRHRGPDAGEAWIAADKTIALIHRRLAIVDLTETGAQPMHSSCGRYVIIYNGEIYNAPELRRDLEIKGRIFRGHSDTEAILEGISEWGVRRTVQQLIGMFAFAVWDKKLATLTLARDRLGIKPLYWAKFGKMFLFASELKALRTVPGWQPELDRDSIAAYLRHNYIPAPFSIYRGVWKLEPGKILTVQGNNEPALETYWDLDTVVAAGLAKRQELGDRSDAEVIEELDDLLSDATRRRMVADVPLGALLSGGIDSSTVVALMQKTSASPVHTFSIGFHEEGFNEAPHAKKIAEHLGTNHTELYLSSDDALSVIPKLQTVYDEPFSDSSQIPTLLVSELAHRHVIVALSGDGGDEVFAGYSRYFLADQIRRKLGLVPPPIKRMAAGAIQTLLPQINIASTRLGKKLYKAASFLRESDEALYLRLVSHWMEPEDITIGGTERPSVMLDSTLTSRLPNYIERLQYLDTKTYLPDDILTKVDRASMAVSLEARIPLLDHRVIEFSWALPGKFKIRDGHGKWILRKVLSRYVPETLFDRPKMGFGVPIDRWLRGPLREWADDLLSERSLKDGGIFRPAPVRNLWADHLSGNKNWQYHLWDILMFQTWQRGAGLA